MNPDSDELRPGSHEAEPHTDKPAIEPPAQNQRADSAKAQAFRDSLHNVDRLLAVQQLDVFQSPPPRKFQMLVELVNKLLGTPVSLISLVTDERQFFLASSGLGDPWASRRETPLTHSFCQHVVTSGEPLVIHDAQTNALVKDNLAIADLGVKAYLGVPIILQDGSVVGSLCAIDTSPRKWSQEDQEVIQKLVEVVTCQMDSMRDVWSQREILEDRLVQAQKMQAIGHLVGGVAHDFNNVLGAIQVQVELMQRTKSLEPGETILQSVGSAKAIVQQLLNWSRPSSEKAVLVSLNQVVEDSLPLLSGLATKFVEIHFEPTDCRDVILADSNKLSQVLLNLCSNAAFAMKASEGRILIEVSEAEVNEKIAGVFGLQVGPHVMLRVSDSGCGVPADVMKRIHDPYFTTKPVGPGASLGLWTVFGIVQRFGGQVFVESEENAGTEIKIYFPRCDEPAKNVATTEVGTKVRNKDCLRLLVVDDESAIVQGLERLLNLSGHQARGFTNSCEALKVFVDDPDSVDVVITDQVMPLLSGEELIREIKAIRPEVPVILCSGYSEAFQREDAASQQADAYFEKPFKFADLIELIKSICSEA